MARILLPVLLLCALLGGLVWFLSPGPVRPPAPPPLAGTGATAAQANGLEPVHSDAQPRVDPPAEPRERVVAADDHADAAQGVRGRVLQPGGAPAANVPVCLLKGTRGDLLQGYLDRKMGKVVPPLAQGRTAADGTFALGITAASQTCDLRVAADDCPELQRNNLEVRDGEWYDAKDLQLQPGVVVQGRVVAEDGGAPIAGAKVSLTTQFQTSFQAAPTPGREHGLQVQTDNGGFFRFANAPREGAITLSAEAPEYASAERTGLQIRTDALNEFDLALSRGTPITGVVVDARGTPIGSAQITATAMSAKVPASVNVHCGSDGAFATPNLRDGPYRLTATANGYEDKAVQATAGEEVKVVMEQRCQVKLRVLGARGAPVKAYSLSLRRFFPSNPGSIGKVLEFPENQRITPADYHGTDWATIANVPVGEFMFQIADNEHAKTLSPPFQVTAGQNQAPQVEVTLTMGAGVTGLVVDDRGQPVADATVGTDRDGGFFFDEGGFGLGLGGLVPDKHTKTAVQTDGGGRFTIRKLAFADYMLRVRHASFCEGASLGIRLDTEGQMLDVGTVTLCRGAIVEGTCSVGGQPAGQIKVQIGPPEGQKPETDSQGRPKMYFSASAVSDNQGHYRLLKRVPPGVYRIYASRQANGNGDVFAAILDMKETARELRIGGGQEQSIQAFELRGR
jgi:uncharacterized GH25 family protein